MKNLRSRFPVREHAVNVVVEKSGEKPRLISRLWVQGSDSAFVLLQSLPERGLAIVGTRNPRDRTLEHMKNVVTQLRGQRLIILSGFARGVDACAHAAALDAGLPTVAFIACGHNINYPSQHAELRARILENNGLIISEYGHDAQPFEGHFLDRNGVLVAHSHAVWIAEAPYQSGAMNTAAHARRMGRMLFATPAFPTDTAYLGNLKLLHQDHVGTPLVDARSLGTAWLEFASAPKVIDSCSRVRADLTPSCQMLVKLVHEMMQEQRTTVLDAILGSWIDRGQPHAQFFSALAEAFKAKALKHSAGGAIST